MIFFFSGCSQRPSSKLPINSNLSTEHIYIHTVSADNENFSALVAWYTGNVTNLDVVSKYNCVSRAGALPRGLRIKIPAHLVTTTEPLDPKILKQWPTKKIQSVKKSVLSSTSTNSEAALSPATDETTDSNIVGEVPDREVSDLAVEQLIKP